MKDKPTYDELEKKLEKSEEKFKSFFTNNKAMMLQIDYRTKQIIDVNNSAIKFYGYTKEEILNKTIYDINCLEPQYIDNLMMKAMKNDSNFFNFIHKLKNGELKDVEVYASPVINGYDSMFIIINDISHRKKQEEENKKLKTAIDQLPLTMIITDKNGIIEYVNPYFTKLTGYNIKDVIGKNHRILNSNLIPKKTFENLWKTIVTGNIWEGNLINKKKNGDIYIEKTIINPIKNNNDEIYNFMVIKEDITDKIKIEEKLKKQNISLRKAKNKAIESDKLKSAFLANMSHEIRTPLNSIVGFSSLFATNDIRPDKIKTYINYINKSSEQLIKIINDLIDISKIEANQLIITKEKIELKPIMSHLFEIFKNENSKSDVNLIYNEDIKNIVISTDKVRLEQILINLLSNALKFTDYGYVEFGYEIINKYVKFYVKDTGIGIKEENREIIFDRFRQVDLGLNKIYGGNGLGLSISKSLITLLGGKIWIESNMDNGSIFYFTIQIDNDTLKEKKDENIKFDELKIKDKTILIAEDEDINYLLISKMLLKYELNLIRVTNGLDAVLEFERNSNIDMILMDVKMPILDGYGATKKIREIDKYIPIIIVTAYALSEDKEYALNSGCNGYLTKPIIKKDLINMIKKYI